jgi:NADPH-dependent glutamate synthase beta subunit-like oxidoreductase
MDKLNLTIDGQSVECPARSTVLEAADAAGIYIPRLCYHPDLAPAREVTWSDAIQQVEKTICGEEAGVAAGDKAHCGLCLVEIEGHTETKCSCVTPAASGLVVRTNSEAVTLQRQNALSRLLADHPHACLTCAQKEGCSRTDCSANVPVEERCCVLLGRCELEKVSDYIGIPRDTPRYVPAHRAQTTVDPLYDRDFELCIGCLRCVRICQEVQKDDVLGAVWKDDRVRIGTIGGATLAEANCRFCGACVQICPTGALLDKDGMEPVRCDAALPCVAHCPAGIDIPRYLSAIAAGQDRLALAVIRARVPFPGILGYACFHPCEDACRRGEVDQPVAICELKRYVADAVPDWEFCHTSVGSDTGKRIAIVGSGPAGSSAAYYLRLLGHGVDMFDRECKPGGLLRYGIPDYRLPPDILDRDFDILKALGVSFHMNHGFVGGNWIGELKSHGFDSILLAIGVSASKYLSIENADLDGIYPALEFLKSAKESQQPRLKGQVVVIGGGNVAIDAAMTAGRLGADSVHLVCLESREEMPAHEWEIAQAEEEGIEIHPSWGPERFMSTGGRLSGIELKKCIAVFDSQGRFDPRYDADETEHIPADSIIVAIGQRADLECFQTGMDFPAGPGDTIRVGDDMSIGVEGVFAAGDVTRGPSSVVDAIADGRRAAEAIDRFFGGAGSVVPDRFDVDIGAPVSQIPSDQFFRPRHAGVIADALDRKSDFRTIVSTLTESEARAEAGRCSRCYLRQRIKPILLPPERWLPLTSEAVASIPEANGVFQLLNDEKTVIRISGTTNLQQSLTECLESPGDAAWFLWEEDPMYTKRESELIQQHLQKHGELPGAGLGGDDLDDLY